jgi:hypothetical protein
VTESEKLVMGVESEALLQTASARESWRIFGIMSEFVEATERLAAIKPAVTIFGSARITAGTAVLRSDRENGAPAVRLRLFGHFRRRPGHHGSGQQGRLPRQVALSVGLNIQLPHEQQNNPYQDISQTRSATSSPASTCSSASPAPMS